MARPSKRACALQLTGNHRPTCGCLFEMRVPLLTGGDYRRAVIDAGTAAELAVTEILDQDLATTDSVLRDALIDRSRTLEGRAKLMKDLGAGSVPETFKNDLQVPRNKAAHGGVPQTLADATKALAVATNLVEQAEPSLGLIPEGDPF